MIVWFAYRSENSFDKNPLILYLYKDIESSPRLLHGINLNYLTENSIIKLMNKIIENTPVTEEAEGLTRDITGRWRDEAGRFTKAPGTVEKPHTRVMFKGSGLTGKGEMLAFYRRLRQFPFINIRETYRTYNENKISGIKVVNLKL